MPVTDVSKLPPISLERAFEANVERIFGDAGATRHKPQKSLADPRGVSLDLKARLRAADDVIGGGVPALRKVTDEVEEEKSIPGAKFRVYQPKCSEEYFSTMSERAKECTPRRSYRERLQREDAGMDEIATEDFLAETDTKLLLDSIRRSRRYTRRRDRAEEAQRVFAYRDAEANRSKKSTFPELGGRGRFNSLSRYGAQEVDRYSALYGQREPGAYRLTKDLVDKTPSASEFNPYAPERPRYGSGAYIDNLCRLVDDIRDRR